MALTSVKTYTGDNQVSFSGEVAIKNTGVGLIREYAVVNQARTRSIMI